MASTDFLWMAQMFTLVALVGTAVLTVVIAKWLMSDVRDINERIAEIEKSTYVRIAQNRLKQFRERPSYSLRERRKKIRRDAL